MDKSNTVKIWFWLAQSDLNTARRCLLEVEDDGVWVYTEPRAACFHCQQAAEKALKGYLRFCGIEPPKIHDLETLCQLCIEQDEAFAEYLDVSDTLTKYCTDMRYGDDDVLDLTDEIAEQEIVKAKTIFDFCKSKVNIEQ